MKKRIRSIDERHPSETMSAESLRRLHANIHYTHTVLGTEAEERIMNSPVVEVKKTLREMGL